MAFTHDAGSSNIIDLTEEDDPVEASKAHPAHGNFATFKTIGKTETPRRSGTQETLASATSRVEAATSLLSSRLDSYKQSPKSKSNSNTSPLRKSLYADQIARTVSNVFQKPMSISDASLPRPLPFQPLESHSVPRLGGFRPPERQPSSADVRQGTSDEVWDLPESDSDEVLFDREESRLEQNVPRETPTTTPETLLVTSRAPRKAASSASRAITGSYEILNPLEASLEARVTTPRKAGRPRKDEWTPTKKPGSGRGNKQSEIVGSYNEGRSISPTPQGTTCLIPAKDESIPSAEASSVRTLSKKRKRSSVSGDDVPPPKGPGVALSPLLKSDNIADPHEKNCELLSTTQQLARMPELDFTRASWNAQTDSQSVPRGLSVSSSSLPAVVTPVEDMVSQFNSSIALTANAVLTKIFDTIVYPAIKKATKHYKGSLHDDKLVLIGKSIADDVVKKELAPFASGTLLQPDEDQKKRIKRFVKKNFKQRVRKYPPPANAPSGAQRTSISENAQGLNQSSAGSMQDKDWPLERIHSRVPETSTGEQDRLQVPREPQGEKITNLSKYIKTLEDQALQSDPELFEEPTNLPRNEACSDCRKSQRRCIHDEFGIEDPVRARESAIPKPKARSNLIVKAAAPAKRLAGVKQALAKDGSPQDHSLQNTRVTRSPSTAPNLAVISDSPDPLSIEDPLDPNFASNEPFPPGFDRGRFPSQRRRRGNKFYTPERPPTTSFKVVPSDSALFGDRIPRHAPVKSVGTTQYRVRGTSGQFRRSHNLLDTVPSQDILKRESARRVNSDQTLKELTQIVASGQASPSQLDMFKKYIDKVGASVHFLESDAQRQKTVQPASMNEDTVMADMPHESHQSAASTQICLTQWHTDSLRQMAKSMIVPLKRELSPVSRALATALDPDLERLVAVLVTDKSATPRPNVKETRYHITEEDQERLVEDEDLLKYIDISPSVYSAPDAKSVQPKFVRVETKVVDPAYRPQRTISSLLRNRELGSDTRGRYLETLSELRLRNAETIEPWRYWKGASGDIVAAAWASDSTTYAVGAAAHTNVEDLQYNRPCNLMLGELTSNVLTELPDHRVNRRRPETIPSGPNATQAVYDACDPMVYQTVTSIAFSLTGTRMYTASHDQTVKIWDVPRKRCMATVPHDAWVTSIEASPQRAGLFATASKCIQDSIRIYYSQASDDSLCRTQFSSSRAQKKPFRQIYPECLRWGPTPQTSHLLLAGFQQWSDEGEGGPGEGQLLLWDANAFQAVKVSPSSQSVYAAAWHPTQPFFATAGAPGSVITDKLTTKSVVRTWDVRSSTHFTMEYECSALDMQDITFSPLDSNLVAAGCIDGTSFVWDFRRPDQPLHRLRHGRPIVGWDHGEDAGVMMSLWGHGGTLFYTGSSDGIIKAWDIRRHPQDVLVRNVAQFGAGIQSGAFSPDGTNLLVGDADGGVHILSSAPSGPRIEKYDRGSNCKEETIRLVRAPDGSGRKLSQDDENPGTEGREAADELLSSGSLEYFPNVGVGRGPNYHGPYSSYWRKEPAESNKRGRLKPEIDEKQPFSRYGERRDEIANGRRVWLEARRAMILNQRNTSKPEEDEKITRVLGRLRENLMLHVPSEADTSRSSSMTRTPNQNGTPGRPQLLLARQRSSSVKQSSSSKASDYDSAHDMSDTDITESEMVEENYWWPRLGEDEIEMARAGKRKVDQKLY